MEKKLFSKDFTLVVIGQIISLFGNAAVRFALPLYLLNLTGSSALYGAVMACAFIPSILLSPVGGIVADRVNKRNIMVILDFSTAGLILAFALLLNRAPLVPLMAVCLMLLYGIAGAYQPAVQASIPLLAQAEQLTSANAVINMVQTLSALLGPVIGGVLFGAFGIRPILFVGILCFFLSAVMELFIRIPHSPRAAAGGVEQRLQIHLSGDRPHPPQDHPAGEVLQGRGDRVLPLGKQQGIHPVGQQGDVVAAGGQPPDQPEGGGEHHLGVAGEVALQLQEGLVPVAVAVVHRPPVGQTVQELGVDGGGAPQHRLLEAVLGHGFLEEVRRPVQPPAGKQGLLPGPRQGDGQGVGGDVLPHPPALLRPGDALGGRRLDKEDPGVPQAGQQLLGAVGPGPPGGVGQAEKLLHGAPSSNSRAACSRLIRSSSTSRAVLAASAARSRVRSSAASSRADRRSAVISSRGAYRS